MQGKTAPNPHSIDELLTLMARLRDRNTAARGI